MKRYIAASLLLCGLLHAEALSPTCYRDNDKNVVICNDKKLGRLMWQDEKQGFKVTWDEAQKYCKTLSLAGYKDWRLPTKVELLSIADHSRYNPALNTALNIQITGAKLNTPSTRLIRGSWVSVLATLA